MNGYIAKIEEIDRALTVFGREKAFIAEDGFEKAKELMVAPVKE